MRAIASAGAAFVFAAGVAAIAYHTARATVTAINRRGSRNARILREREERRNGVVMPVLGQETAAATARADGGQW